MNEVPTESTETTETTDAVTEGDLTVTEE